MGSADTSRKSVPEWLNSSLWSSPRSSPSPSPSPSPASRIHPPARSHEKEAPPPLQQPPASTPPIQSHDSKPQYCKSGPLEESSPHTIIDPSADTVDEAQQPFSDEQTKTSSPVKHHNGTDDEGEESDLFDSNGPLPFSPYPLPGHAPLSQSETPAMPTASVTRSSSFDSRVDQFNLELSKEVISIRDLQRLASQGIPDHGSIRATAWKLLLGYLPKSRDLWSAELQKKRAEYTSFKEELLVTPSEITRRKELEGFNVSSEESPGPLPRHDITHDDHPLSLGKTSIWHQYFLDAEVCEQIDRDVKRTHPDMHFFCGDSAASLENQEAMKRVLFIFSKLNPGIRYVQGMNEVLAPLYYVFRTDADEMNAANAEADSFFCFVALLGDFRDHFVQQLDNSAVGIRSTIARLNGLLKRHDEELWRHLEFTSKVNPQFYSFRWITLLLTQEFSFPDSLRLWDSLLANPDGPLEILLRVCCAMLMSVRSRLLAGDFTANLKLLQHYPPVDIHHLIRLAGELKAKDYFSD